MSDPIRPLHVVGTSVDAAELVRIREEIAQRDRQETAIAELGQAALTGVDSSILMGQACALVELTLRVDHCRILEFTPAGRVVLTASIGSNVTFNHCDRDDEENESIAMYVSLAGAPITFGDEPETRFRCSHLRAYHNVRAGAGVAIPTAAGNFGALLAYTSEARRFPDYEVAFLRSTAALLGEALERSRTETALRKSETRLRQLIASALDPIVSFDRSGVVIEWNPQAEETFGLKSRDILGRPLPDAILTGLTGDPARRRVESVARRASGEMFPVEISIEPVGSGSDQTFTAFIRDISERKRAQEELEKREQRFRALVEKSWSGVALLDENLAFTYSGASTERLVGYDDRQLIGTSILGYVHPRERPTVRDLFRNLAASAANSEATGELRFLHKDGSWVWLEGFAQNLLHDPAVGAIVINYRDITQRKQAEKQLEYQAYYDALTGLPNRLLFRDRVVNAIAHACRNRYGVAVMYLDLDHFKLVNDGLGHSIGDQLLSQVADRLQALIRASDTISRHGGDEFTILLNDVGNSDSVAAVAHKLLQSLVRPFRVERHVLFVTASVGISLFPNDGEDVETLLRAADSAMYRAKELGRNQAQLFTASMNERYERRLALEQSLHHALEREQLELHYQPVLDRSRRHVTAVEALIRWNHPQRGLVPPSDFIPLAEETGLIVPIGEWVTRHVCRQLREWHDAGLTDLKAAINISAPQLQQPTFVAVVRDALRANGVPASALQIEITETAAVQNIDLTMQVLAALKELGVGIAIDDFGTGQSSLVYLTRFPIDIVKVDRTFVNDVTTDDSAAAIVSYVINLAHALRLEVVAEGVETEEQYAFLRLAACDKVQGYLFARPMPASDVAEFVRQP